MSVYDFSPDAVLAEVKKPTPAKPSVFGPPAAASWRGWRKVPSSAWVLSGKWWTMVMYSKDRSGGRGIISGRRFYRSVRGLGDFEPWLERIRPFPEEIVDHALKKYRRLGSKTTAVSWSVCSSGFWLDLSGRRI